MSDFKTLGENYGGNIVDFLRWEREERNKFLATKFRENLNYKYELDLLGEPMKNLKLENQDLKQRIREKKAAEAQSNYVFITVNPKKDVDFEKFRELCEKFAQRKMFKKSWLVFEQRGKTEEELGKGFHAHIECVRNVDYKPSQVIRNTRNTFKNVCNLQIEETLKIQHHGEDFHKDKMEYIDGVKTGEGKEEKQIMDVIFRKNKNLQVIYNYATS